MSKKRLYEIIYEVSRTVNSSLDPTEVLNRIAEQVTRAMDVKGCFIRLLDRTGKVLKPAASFGLSERYARKGTVEVAKSGQEAAEEGLVSVLVAPLFVEGSRPIGVMRVYAGERREFEAEDIGFLQAIANISAIAIENARMHQTLKRQMELINAYDYQVFED